MVALTPRFAALFTFVALASVSFAPLPTDAVVIPKSLQNSIRGDASSMAIPASGVMASLPSAPAYDGSTPNNNATQGGSSNEARSVDWKHTRSLANFARVMSRRRLQQRAIIDLSPFLRIEIDLLRRREGGLPLTRRFVNEDKQAPFTSHKRHAESGGQVGKQGRLDVVGSGGELLGSLLAKDYVLSAAKNDFTLMTLLFQSPSRARDSNKPDTVMLQACPQDASNSSQKRCVTYDCAASTPSPLRLKECKFSPGNEETSDNDCQMFRYEAIPDGQGKGTVQPIARPSTVDSGSQSQNILQRGEDPSYLNATLVFAPIKQNEQSMMASNASTVISTITTTITVTGSPTSSMSAAEVESTSSSNRNLTESSGVPTITSTASLSPPTASVAPASVAGALDVQVVEPSNASNTSTTTVTSEPAAPSTTINAEEIASSIAASTVTDAPLAPTSSADATSSVAAMENSVAMSSGTETSAAPAMTSSSAASYN